MPSAFNCHPCCRKAFTPAVTCTVSSPSENRIGAGWSDDEEAIRIADRVAMDGAVLVLLVVVVVVVVGINRVAFQSPRVMPGCTARGRQSREKERSPRCMIDRVKKPERRYYSVCVGNGQIMRPSKWMRDGDSATILTSYYYVVPLAVNLRQEQPHNRNENPFDYR